jgi:hypothetical protein
MTAVILWSTAQHASSPGDEGVFRGVDAGIGSPGERSSGRTRLHFPAHHSAQPPAFALCAVSATAIPLAAPVRVRTERAGRSAAVSCPA